jgi:hypothetical protein
MERVGDQEGGRPQPLTVSSRQRQGAALEENMLDRMIATYDRGLLVPFIGAGMSYPACRLWGRFVAQLEKRANRRSLSNDSDLVHRAARAVQVLRFRVGSMSFADEVRAALSKGPVRPPPQTTELASIFWPLVVTTNYDDLYLAAAHEAYVSRPEVGLGEKREVPLLLLGRSAAHCQRVLTSLRQPDVPILWALQGFVGGQAKPLQHQLEAPRRRARYRAHMRADDKEHVDQRWTPLETELVVGHAEYRKVALASEPFRRAFAELYRSRSLLFLGSGLKDKYFLDLFSEIIELYGPSPQAHYVFLKTGESDCEFLRQYFGIWVWELKDYKELPGWLRKFKELVTASRERQIAWHLGQASNPSFHPSGVQAGLRILRRELPREPPDGECIVFSVGGAKEFLLSHVGIEILQDKGLSYGELAFERLERLEGQKLPLWRHTDAPGFLAIKARMDPWGENGAHIRPTDPTQTPIGHMRPPDAGGRMWRDIRLVSLAVQELIQAVHILRHSHVHCMLLAAGELRTFAPSHALLQMVRGWAKRRSEAGPLPELSIYLTEPDVLYDLDAGRLELTRNLVPDVVQFWLEIRHDGEFERYLRIERIDCPIQEVLADFDIKDDKWSLELLPHPCLKWANWTLGDVRAWKRHVGGGELSLETFGVLPGSTLKAFKPGTKPESMSEP